MSRSRSLGSLRRAVERSDVPQLATLLDDITTPPRSLAVLFICAMAMACLTLALPGALVVALMLAPRATLDLMLSVGWLPATAVVAACFALPLTLLSIELHRVTLREISKYPESALGSRKKPTLYLRRFQTENTDVWSSQDLKRRGLPWQTFFAIFNPFLAIDREDRSLETFLQRTLRRFGPIICIGDPLKRRSPGIASRVYVRDESWQDAVLLLASTSNLIVLDYEQGGAVDWEAETLLERTKNPILIWMEPLVIPYELRKTARKSDYFPSWMRSALERAGIEQDEEPAGEDGYLFLFDADRELRYARTRRVAEVVRANLNKLLRESDVRPEFRRPRPAVSAKGVAFTRLLYQIAPPAALVGLATFAMFQFVSHPPHGSMRPPSQAERSIGVLIPHPDYLYGVPHYEDEFKRRGDLVLAEARRRPSAEEARDLSMYAYGDFEAAARLNSNPNAYAVEKAEARLQFAEFSTPGDLSIRVMTLAISDFESVGNTDGVARALALRSRTNALLGRYDAAFADVERLVTLDEYRGHMSAADVYEMRARHGGGYADTNQALQAITWVLDQQRGQSDSDAYATRGWILFDRGDLQSAVRDFQRGATLAPESQINAEGLCLVGGKYGLALDDAERSCVLLGIRAPDDVYLLLRRGQIEFRQGRITTAIDLFSRGIAMAEQQNGEGGSSSSRAVLAEMLYLRGLSHARVGDSQERDADMRRAFATDADVALRLQGQGFQR